MKYTLQVFTGPWNAAFVRAEDVARRIGEIASRLPVNQVIIGWNADPSLYEKTGAFLHARGVKMLLWLPVFSEAGEWAEPEEALDIWGNPIVTPALQEGEDFRFGCPSSPRNARMVKDIYEKYFSACGFDGVFLDKIRTQSFVSGVPGVLCCGCARCRRAFLKRGVDLEAVGRLYTEKKDSFFDMASYPMNGEFRLKHPLAERFFEAKEEIVADAVAGIRGYFQDKGMIVGLDLFAPAVSRFVGQSYARIAKGADFVKPMLYRMTEAPAGIGYEYALFEKYAPNAQGRGKLSLDRAFLGTQLEAVRRAACEVCPGIEINYRADIARTDPAYIRESLTAVKAHGFDRAVLCWNVMQAPEAHIDVIAEMEEAGGVPAEA